MGRSAGHVGGGRKLVLSICPRPSSLAERKCGPQYLPMSHSAWAGRAAHSHHPANAPQIVTGACDRSYRAVGEVRENASPAMRSSGSSPSRLASPATRNRQAAPELLEGRGIDGPPQDSLRPKAVERGAAWRNSSPRLHVRKGSRQPLSSSPMALLVFLPRPTRTSLIPPRLLNSGHRLPHALFSAVGR